MCRGCYWLHSFMITGYNTDVAHGDVVLHVQTEDKGLANPCIESLVYVGGQVLVAKRASYAEKLAEGSSEKDIIALMDRQHRTMIAAIRHGKFDEKLAGMLGDSTLSAGTRVAKTPPLSVADDGEPSPIPPPVAEPLDDGEIEMPVAEPADGTSGDQTLDQVILEYLTHEAEQEQLVLLLEESENVGLGQHATLALRARSSKNGQGVSGTGVSVKMISTASEPKVLARGEAEDDGSIRLSFDIPHLARGTSALIITASSDIGRAELKQLL